eukprot:1062299-Prymnesium_polylepis.1
MRTEAFKMRSYKWGTEFRRCGQGAATHQQEPSFRANNGSPFEASSVGCATVECVRKARQLSYVQRPRDSHHVGLGVSSFVANTSSIIPRMASSSPSGALPVLSSEINWSSNFHEGKHSCCPSHRSPDWHELFVVRSHMRRQPRYSSNVRLTANCRRGCTCGSPAAIDALSITPYPCPSLTTPPAAPPEECTARMP